MISHLNKLLSLLLSRHHELLKKKHSVYNIICVIIIYYYNPKTFTLLDAQLRFHAAFNINYNVSLIVIDLKKSTLKK